MTDVDFLKYREVTFIPHSVVKLYYFYPLPIKHFPEKKKNLIHICKFLYLVMKFYQI